MGYGPGEKAILPPKTEIITSASPSSSFDSNVIEGPVLCHQLSHICEHLLLSQHLTA